MDHFFFCLFLQIKIKLRLQNGPEISEKHRYSTFPFQIPTLRETQFKIQSTVCLRASHDRILIQIDHHCRFFHDQRTPRAQFLSILVIIVCKWDADCGHVLLREWTILHVTSGGGVLLSGLGRSGRGISKGLMESFRISLVFAFTFFCFDVWSIDFDGVEQK